MTYSPVHALRLLIATLFLYSPLALAERLSYQATASDIWKLSVYDSEGNSLTDGGSFFSRRADVNSRGQMHFSMSVSYPATFVVERPKVLLQFVVRNKVIDLAAYSEGDVATFVVQSDGTMQKAAMPAAHRLIDWQNIRKPKNWVGVKSSTRGKFVAIGANGEVLMNRELNRRGISHEISWREKTYPVTFIVDNYKKAQAIANRQPLALAPFGEGDVAAFQMDKSGKISRAPVPSNYEPVDWAELERQQTLSVLRHAAMNSLFQLIQDPKYNEPSLGDRKFEVTTQREVISVVLRRMDVDMARDLLAKQDGVRRVESSEHAIAIDAAFEFRRSGVHVTIDRRRKDVILTYGDSSILKGDI